MVNTGREQQKREEKREKRKERRKPSHPSRDTSSNEVPKGNDVRFQEGLVVAFVHIHTVAEAGEFVVSQEESHGVGGS